MPKQSLPMSSARKPLEAGCCRICAHICGFFCRSFLRSLDPRNISNGAAEILKMACIKDETLFNVLDGHAEELRSSSFQVMHLDHLALLWLLPQQLEGKAALIWRMVCVIVEYVNLHGGSCFLEGGQVCSKGLSNGAFW